MANSLYWGVLVEFIFLMLNSHVHFFVIVVVVSVIYVVNILLSKSNMVILQTFWFCR